QARRALLLALRVLGGPDAGLRYGQAVVVERGCGHGSAVVSRVAFIVSCVDGDRTAQRVVLGGAPSGGRRAWAWQGGAGVVEEVRLGDLRYRPKIVVFDVLDNDARIGRLAGP